MNWRRGLLRLWLALSLCWIVGVGALAWERGPVASRDQALAACFEARKAEGANALSCLNEVTPRNDPVRLVDIPITIKEYGAYALLPPLIAFVLGLLGAWVVAGFARKGTGEMQK
jgi:hypothetical protein